MYLTSHTPQGPRQQIICSLGALAPGPREQWLTLAHKLGAALQGQLSLTPTDPQLARLVAQVRRGRTPSRTAPKGPASVETVAPDQVTIEEAREAGPVHVGHQMWRRLGLGAILRRAGLLGSAISPRRCSSNSALRQLTSLGLPFAARQSSPSQTRSDSARLERPGSSCSIASMRAITSGVKS